MHEILEKLTKAHPNSLSDPEFVALNKDDVSELLHGNNDALLVAKDSLARATISRRLAYSLGNGMRELDTMLKKSEALYDEEEGRAYICDGDKFIDLSRRLKTLRMPHCL